MDFTQDASVTVCTISRIPERKAHLFLGALILETPQQMIREFEVCRLPNDNAVNHRAAQMRRICRSMLRLDTLAIRIINLVPKVRYGRADRHPLYSICVLVPLDAAMLSTSIRLDLFCKDTIEGRNVKSNVE